MKPKKLTLIDSTERHRNNPATVSVLSEEQKQKIWKEDSDNIGVEVAQGSVEGETTPIDDWFWVRIRKITPQGFEGVITTGPLFSPQHGLKHLDTVCFETRHIAEAVIYDCLQCKHADKMGFSIPDEDLTPDIVKRLCPNCRAALPFEQLACPISREQMLALCDRVGSELEDRPCDHTLRLAEEFCQRQGLPCDAVLSWLREQGGYCDCEVVLNVADRLEDDRS